MSFAIHPGPLGPAFEQACRRLEHARFSEALWKRDLGAWSDDAQIQKKISARLGWLDAPRTMHAHVPRLRAFAAAVEQARFTDVVLLGMGGSSLAAEVMRAAIGVTRGFPRFQVLDSVDPDSVRPAMARPATTLFLLASKSGSTIELTTLAAEAKYRLREAGVLEPGSHFVAITDADTVLERRAADERFRDLFVNPSDIGGRFSALSLFGLVPAALMGIDIDALLGAAQRMAEQCRIDDPRRNPGLTLGALMGAASLAGRDKLTLIVPPVLDRFGLWAEQLVAESTGKRGRGVVPIVGEAYSATPGRDRVVAAIALDERAGSAAVESASATQIPVVTLRMSDVMELGAEFFRWEVATATAGWLLDVNPFDEPNVQQAKDATRALLATYSAQRHLPVPEPDVVIEGVRIVLTGAAKTALGDNPPSVLLDLLRPGDYFALLAYLPPDDERFLPELESIRRVVAEEAGCATTVGFGPRYLHSTGQLHKGGPNSGVFLIVTGEPSDDLPIPGEPCTFGVLEMAQAVGDFESLERAGRRAMHVHLPRRDPSLLREVIGRVLRRS